MIVKSGEKELVGRAGTNLNTRIYTVYDPEAEQYKWMKVFKQASEEDFYSFKLVFFSPDGSKVLAAQYLDNKVTLVYLDAETGEQLAGVG